MSSPLEAAADYLGMRHSDAFDLVTEWFRAAIGCPKCNGNGTISYDPDGYYANHACDQFCPCPAEHVEIPVFGETIWADPDKAWWACVGEDGGNLSTDGPFACQAWPEDDHSGCGWVPRIDALLGDE